MKAIQSLAVSAILFGCASSQNRAVNTVPNEARAPQGQRSVAPAPSENASNVHVARDIREACGLTDTEAFFTYNSAHVRPGDKTTLQKIAECFTQGPLRGRQLKLVGHADPRGDAEYNYLLGQRRADSIAGEIAAAGMPREKSATSSRGANEATGTDETSWAKDRRVDLLLGD